MTPGQAPVNQDETTIDHLCELAGHPSWAGWRTMPNNIEPIEDET